MTGNETHVQNIRCNNISQIYVIIKCTYTVHHRLCPTLRLVKLMGHLAALPRQAEQSGASPAQLDVPSPAPG